MHIPDNYLSPQTDAVMAVAMVPVWAHCIKKVRAALDRERMAFLGICAAFSFLLMMFNVPLPGGHHWPRRWWRTHRAAAGPRGRGYRGFGRAGAASAAVWRRRHPVLWR